MYDENETLSFGEETQTFLELLEKDESLDGDSLSKLLMAHKIDKLKLIAEHTIDVVCLHHPIDGRYLYASPSTKNL